MADDVEILVRCKFVSSTEILHECPNCRKMLHFVRQPGWNQSPQFRQAASERTALWQGRRRSILVAAHKAGRTSLSRWPGPRSEAMRVFRELHRVYNFEEFNAGRPPVRASEWDPWGAHPPTRAHLRGLIGLDEDEGLPAVPNRSMWFEIFTDFAERIA